MPTLSPSKPSRKRALALGAVVCAALVGAGWAAWAAKSADTSDRVTMASHGSAQAPVRVLECSDGSTRATPFGGAIVNNTWNRKAAGSFPVEQCLVERDTAGAGVAGGGATAQAKGAAAAGREVGWRWNWPKKDSLYAYPGILIGATPWQPGPGNDSRFPRRVGDIRSMPLRYDLQVESDGKFNVAAELWLIDTPKVGNPPDPSAIRAELMVWTDASPGIADASTVPKIAQVTLEGREWDVHVKDGWGGGVGLPNRWMFIVYVAKVPTRAIRYDMKAFLDDAVKRQLISQDHYVADFELGNEIISGRGVTWVRDFALEVK